MNVHLRILPGTHAPTDGVAMRPASEAPAPPESVTPKPLTEEERNAASEYLREMISALPDHE